MSKIPKIKSEFSGPSGMAIVQVRESKVRVNIKDVGVFVLSRKNCPAYVQEGKFFVTLSPDKTKMVNMKPITGMFKVKVSDFPAMKDKPPTPRTNSQYGYQYFMVLLEIVEGKQKGMKIPFNLRYNFGEVDFNGESVVGLNHLKSKYTPVLEEFLELSGANPDKLIKYKDNILPVLQQRIMKADRTFRIVLKNGWVDTLLSNEDEMLPDETDVPWEESAEE